MKRILKRIFSITAVLAGTFVVLSVSGFILLNTRWLQQKLLNKAVELLTEKLETRVQVDSVSIDLFTLDAKLYGLKVEDRQYRPMLCVKFAKADFDVSTLLRKREILIKEIRLEDAKTELHRLQKGTDSPDTVPNYQFLLDAFKSDKKKSESKKKTSDEKQKLTFNISSLKADRIGGTYNEDSVHLDLLHLTQDDGYSGKIEQLKIKWERASIKGEHVSRHAEIGSLKYDEKNGKKLIELKKVHLKTDNHLPRKNTGKPHHGAFDVGHFNIWADMKIKIDSIGKDFVQGALTECTVRDTLSGIDIRRLECEATFAGKTLNLKNVHIQQGTTNLHFEKGILQLPDKKENTPLTYSTSIIMGTAVLHDIARPFAPVLNGFKIPLQLCVRMEGNETGIQFHDVVVKHPKEKLSIKAAGYISNLKDSKLLKVHFDVKDATFGAAERETIINQFNVKKFMMSQLRRLGIIRYSGGFDILWRNEVFQGNLQSEMGTLKFNLALDDINNYVQGNISSDRLEIGRIMNMPDIGPVAASAQFKFDYSKTRTAQMRRQLGGKLPIGEVKAHVDDASYKFVKVHNIDVQISSDGATAEGCIINSGKLADIDLNFSFSDTENLKKIKIKPKLKLNIGKKSTQKGQKKSGK